MACALLATLGAALWVRARTLAAGNPPSIAVMPFKTVGGGDEYLADGLTESLTTELGKVPGLRVIASNTAFTYRDRPTLRAIARELNVGLAVTGSVQRDEDSLSIHASVVDTRDGATLWSEHFSTTWLTSLRCRTIFPSRLRARFHGRSALPRQRHQGRRRGMLGVRGVSAWSVAPEGTLGGHADRFGQGALWQAAVQEFERALMLDSEFALARAALASVYAQLHFYDATDRRFDQKAFVEIERALRIDPRLPEAYLARAQLTWTARNRFPHEAAITDLRRAVALNPNLADAHLELEKIYYHIGLTDKAIAAGQQVQRLDPYQAWSTSRTFRTLIDAGRLEQVRSSWTATRTWGLMLAVTR